MRDGSLNVGQSMTYALERRASDARERDQALLLAPSRLSFFFLLFVPPFYFLE